MQRRKELTTGSVTDWVKGVLKSDFDVRGTWTKAQMVEVRMAVDSRGGWRAGDAVG